LRVQNGTCIVGVTCELAPEIFRRTTLKEITVASGLPLEDVNITGYRLAAQPFALLDGVQLETLEVLATDCLGLSGSDYRVFMDVKVTCG